MLKIFNTKEGSQGETEQKRTRDIQKKNSKGNSLVVQWLGLCTFTAEGPGLIPGQGTKIHKTRSSARKKKRKEKK